MKGSIVGLLCVLLAAPAAVSGVESCAGRADLVGPCFPVRGRAALYNGNPSVRIWKVGTRRLLGVSESRCRTDACETLPVAVRSLLDWDQPVFADFVVCPFTRPRAGVMQLVCVESASRVRHGAPAH